MRRVPNVVGVVTFVQLPAGVGEGKVLPPSISMLTIITSPARTPVGLLMVIEVAPLAVIVVALPRWKMLLVLTAITGLVSISTDVPLLLRLPVVNL